MISMGTVCMIEHWRWGERERKKGREGERKREGGKEEQRRAIYNIDKTSIIARFVHVHTYQLEHTFMSIVRSDMYMHA